MYPQDDKEFYKNVTTLKNMNFKQHIQYCQGDNNERIHYRV